jgi:hypothetical protein
MKGSPSIFNTAYKSGCSSERAPAMRIAFTATPTLDLLLDISLERRIESCVVHGGQVLRAGRDIQAFIEKPYLS